MIKKYIHILLILAILSQVNSSFAGTYDDYTKNVDNICKKASYAEEIKTTKKYLEANEYKNNPSFSTYFTNPSYLFILDGVERIYRDNQNKIYKCGLYKAQQNSYNRLEKAIKSEKSGTLSDSIQNTINSKKSFLKEKIKKNGCNTSSKLDDIKTMKLDILKQSTYELCNYTFYLDYLKTDYYDNIENITGFTQTKDLKDQGIETETIGNQDIATKMLFVKSNIDKEISHSYKMYNMVFSSFNEYDSFLPIHMMLEIIKQDYIILRDSLYAEISPINQVGYKIINAMSK